MRFIENRDGPRVATTFCPPKHLVVALMVATLPGARLLHEGEFEGRKVRLTESLAAWRIVRVWVSALKSQKPSRPARAISSSQHSP